MLQAFELMFGLPADTVIQSGGLAGQWSRTIEDVFMKFKAVMQRLPYTELTPAYDLLTAWVAVEQLRGRTPPTGETAGESPPPSVGQIMEYQ